MRLTFAGISFTCTGKGFSCTDVLLSQTGIVLSCTGGSLTYTGKLLTCTGELRTYTGDACASRGFNEVESGNGFEGFGAKGEGLIEIESGKTWCKLEDDGQAWQGDSSYEI